ncbi:dihydrofolate reductase family protein [Deinococcus sp. QL22]|uniref:dihydrofolate reductase family protein n=1 Tax=Deinococcus sp. QL22 TaxID=2939437 RepID=UPI0020182A03|nr:dihydrofolate reductase family protein [Deinococcus sp. QL22]UQN09143.1 dihydrofolate reductase family protein [Deinococcus sp. QL22]
MPRVYLDLAVSQDGFIAGPDGEDGGLHDWYFAETGAAEGIKAELVSGMGAMILGHTAFGSAPDGFDTEYKVPHFILTQTPQASVERGGATFIFITDGIESALAQAKAAAGERDVCVAGGAQTAQAFLKAGLLDELQLHVAPVLLGGGLSLFGSLGQLVKLERVRVTPSQHATHITYRLREASHA